VILLKRVKLHLIFLIQEKRQITCKKKKEMEIKQSL